MATHTTTTITNELDFLGRIWQPGVGLCAGRNHLDSPQVLEIEARAAEIKANPILACEEATTWKGQGIDPMRQACYEWLKANEGDFSEIVDFYADFGAPGVDGFYASEWHTPGHEMAFEAADGYGLEDDDWGEVEDDDEEEAL